MKNDFDNIIKGAILDEVSGLSVTEDIFRTIKNKINTEKGNKKGYRLYIGFSFRKYVLFAVCLFVICTAATFTFSSQARAVVSQTISSIKNIFDVEIIDNRYQIIEKPANEAYFTHAISKVAQLNDKELRDKLGYEVKFPRTLGDSFRIENKALGVVILKPLNLEQSKQLSIDMDNAIEDDNALEQLKPYNALRYTSGLYTKTDGSSVFIVISKEPGLAKIESFLSKYGVVQGQKIQKIKVGKLDGFWIIKPIPIYPTNNVGKEDMTVRPDMVETFVLDWQKNDIFYSLGTYNKGFVLTQKEALKMAEDFMKVN